MILLARADARALPLADGTVQTCVTSPPYWNLRDYGTPGQLGLEDTPEEYVEHMVEVFREVRRVLRDDGTLWLNLGDSYCGGGGFAPDAPCNVKRREMIADGVHQHGAFNLGPSQHSRNRAGGIKSQGSIKPKDLVGIPWMVAFALRADGWYLRSDIIWAKPACMPESVTDRPTRSHEYLFLLTKSATYYYDAEAIKEHGAEPDRKRNDRIGGATGDTVRHSPGGMMGQSITRNRRSVWTINPQPFKGAHYAVMPEKLVEPCILAGTSAKGACPKCGAPWERIISKASNPEGIMGKGNARHADDFSPLAKGIHVDSPRVFTTGWRPTCECDAGDPRPCIVLDPFCGTATVARVAIAHGRRAVCFDLSGEYLSKLATKRTHNVQVELGL